MKILVVTPRSPFSLSGACEKDRTAGILHLKKLGHEVQVVTKYLSSSDDLKYQEAFADEHSIRVVGVPYLSRPQSVGEWVGYLLRYLRARGDGAAAEFFDPAFQDAVTESLDAFVPDLIWVDYTFLWPVYHLFHERKIPIVTRSINYEPDHFLSEVGSSLLTYLKYPPKVYSEKRVVKESAVIAAITPNEEKVYRGLGANKTLTLPLRDLPNVLERPGYVPHERRPLKCCFMGSRYSIGHNRRALEFLLTIVMPELEKRRPGQFALHVTGSKFPDAFSHYLSETVVHEGFVDDLQAFLESVDIAVVPSLAGHGMQQKIFEPLVMGIPTVTHARGLAGYDFITGVEVLSVNETDQFIDAIEKLAKPEVRVSLSEAAKRKAQTLFSWQSFEKRYQTILTYVAS